MALGELNNFADFSFTNPQSVGGYQAPPTGQVLSNVQPIYAASSGTSSPPNGVTTPQTGEKRKAGSISEAAYPAHYDEDARIAAEEDKRRRNTAASARFRVKKKQREQALEKSAKEMADKVAAFEAKIARLETENKWLKGLVIEKKDHQGEKEIAEMFKKFQEESERKGSERKDGVGTVKAEGK